MKATLLILCLATSLLSCGTPRSQKFLGTIVNNGTIAGLEQPASLPLSIKDELPIALRICNALAAKRQFLLNTVGGTTPQRIAYNFSLERKDCNQKVIEATNLVAEILSDLEYSSADSANYFTDVITDTTIALSEVCPAVIANPTNPKIKNSTIPLNSDKIYFVKFTVDSQGFDTVQINTKASNGKGGYDSQDAQLISFITNISQDANKNNLGVEKARSKFVACTGQQFTTQKETFIRSIMIL